MKPVDTPTLIHVLREIDLLMKQRDELLAHIEWMQDNEQNNRKRLSNRDVKEIRELHRKGIKQSDIASIYDVNRATVSRIVRHIYHS